MTQGYDACGLLTVQHVEENRKFKTWLQEKGKQVLRGDIADRRVQAQVVNLHPFMLTAGISCQPFSLLGDGRQQMDERSKSFPAMLQTMYLAQSKVMILECTPAALTSPWIQEALQIFADQTGFVVHQRLLELADVWPARRNRWWCTISHPDLMVQPIPDFPLKDFQPGLVHLLPSFRDLDENSLKQLELDHDEMREFGNRPRMDKRVVCKFKALPTSTHSWGAQIRGCECGCRRNGFHPNRLVEKGLYGQVIEVTSLNTEHPKGRFRHMHPVEVALANGMNPRDLASPDANLRLELTGVGQLASPLQGAWVASNFIRTIEQIGQTEAVLSMSEEERSNSHRTGRQRPEERAERTPGPHTDLTQGTAISQPDQPEALWESGPLFMLTRPVCIEGLMGFKHSPSSVR